MSGDLIFRRVSARILFVEDREDDSYLARRALERGGVDVSSHQRVENESALLTALSDEWDIVLIDWYLPGITAPRAIQVVREVRPDMPCIVVSDAEEAEAAFAAGRLGASDFVCKSRLDRLPLAVRRELSFGAA